MFPRHCYLFETRVDVVTFKETLGYLDRFLASQQPHIITTLNPEILLEAKKNKPYRDALNEADLNVPDGTGLTWLLRMLGGRLEHPVTGADMTLRLLLKAQKHQLRVAVFHRLNGLSSKGELVRAVKERYPELAFFVISASTEEASEQAVLESLKRHQPDIILVDFGAPYQEQWLVQHKHAAPSLRVGMGIGGSLDYLTGRQKRAPRALRNIGLEWLWRLARQPARLPRIWRAVAVFGKEAIKIVWQSKYRYRQNALGVIRRADGKVLVVSRASDPAHWQFPQGGISSGETSEEGVLRELQEELGCATFTIEGKAAKTYTYNWPKGQIQSFRGQEQHIFFLAWHGSDAALHLEKRELSGYQWINPQDIPAIVHPVRREVGEYIVTEMKRLQFIT